MLIVRITIEDKNNSISKECYYTGINSENYEEETLKLIFWLKEHKDSKITELMYKNIIEG